MAPPPTVALVLAVLAIALVVAIIIAQVATSVGSGTGSGTGTPPTQHNAVAAAAALAGVTSVTLTSVSPNAYTVSLTRAAPAASARGLDEQRALASPIQVLQGQTLVAAYSGVPTWSADNTSTLTITADNADVFVAPVPAAAYVAQAAASASSTISSAPAVYVPPYEAPTVVAVGATTYVVQFKRNVTATANAALSVVNGSGAVVAVFSGSTTWVVGTNTLVLSTLTCAATFVPAVDGAAYALALTDAADGAFAATSAATTYTADYNALAVTVIRPLSYAVSFARNVRTGAPATLSVVNAKGAVVALASAATAATWAAAGIATPTLTTSNCDVFVNPVDGAMYAAQLSYIQSVDGTTTSAASAMATYTAPFTSLSMGTITPTSYPCSYVVSSAGAAAPTLNVYQGATLVAAYTGAVPTALGLNTVNVTFDQCSSFTAPTKFTNYTFTLTYDVVATSTVAESPSFYVPTELSVPCELCLDASIASSITATGTAVSAWADQSGVGNNATTLASGTNIVGTPTWDGSSNHLAFASSNGLTGAGMATACDASSNAFELFIVASVPTIAPSNASTFVGATSPTNQVGALQVRIVGNGVQVDNGATTYEYSQNANIKMAAGLKGVIAANQKVIYNIFCSGLGTSTLTAYYSNSGATLHSLAGGTNSIGDGFGTPVANGVTTIGCRMGPSASWQDFLNGNLYFVAKYQAPVSAADKTMLMSYLSTTFSI